MADIERGEPLRVQAKSKKYNIQAPGTIQPLSVPIIEEEKFTRIIERFDICIGTNTTHASGATFEEFKQMQSSRRKNESIKSIKPAMEIFNKFRNISKERALEEMTLLDCPSDSKFAHFVKYLLIDFIVNTMRITPIPINDERTMYVECIVQLFKYFSNITDLLSFSW